MSETIHFCQGHFCTTQELRIHPHDLGFLRAYGVFDFAPVYAGTPFRLREHLERLLESAVQVSIDPPHTLFEMEELTSLLLEKNPELTGGFRYILTGGSYQSDTLLPASEPQLMILTELAPNETPKSIQVVTSTVMRALPQVKTTNYLPAVMGMQKAQKQGFQDALYVNEKGELLEGMTSNLFFVKGGKLYTDDSDQIIKGVTRSVLLDIAKDLMPIELRSITLAELTNCEEAFFTSSTKDLLPIVQIDEQVIGQGSSGPWTLCLRSHFLQQRSREMSHAAKIGSPSKIPRIVCENNFLYGDGIKNSD